MSKSLAPEDVTKVETEPQLGDDPDDCARYGLYPRFAPAPKSKEAEIRARAATITDPIARWSYLHVNLPRAEDQAPFRLNYKMRWEQQYLCPSDKIPPLGVRPVARLW